MYIRRSEDVQDVLWTSNVRSIYILCQRGYVEVIITKSTDDSGKKGFVNMNKALTPKKGIHSL